MQDDLSRQATDRLQHLTEQAKRDSAALSGGSGRFKSGQAKFDQLIDAIQSTLQNKRESPVGNVVKNPGENPA
jgi:hypothetical protein